MSSYLSYRGMRRKRNRTHAPLIPDTLPAVRIYLQLTDFITYLRALIYERVHYIPI